MKETNEVARLVYVCAVLLLILICCSVVIIFQLRNGAAAIEITQPAKESRSRFEYKVFNPPDSMFEDYINSQGAAGWEIISARRATSPHGGSPTYELIMKREKSTR